MSWLATADLPRDRPDEIASSAAVRPRKQAEDRELRNEQVAVVVVVEVVEVEVEEGKKAIKSLRVIGRKVRVVLQEKGLRGKKIK